MQVAPARPRDPAAPQPELPFAWYSVLGVPVAVASDVAEALACVDATYAAFRAAPGELGDAIALRMQRGSGGAFDVADAAGTTRWPNYQDALLNLLDRLVHALLARLLARGLYAIHAGAAVYRGRALILAGRSGQGKTTLALALLRRGLGLLSDEFAVADPARREIVPYRRSLHVRPGTLDLIPELGFLRARPRQQLGGGSEWAVAPRELEQTLPGCLAPAAPLGHVLLLAGVPRPAENPSIAPVPAAVAALELLRGAWATSVDFAGALGQFGRLLDGVPCARLQVGALEPTLDAIVAWLETSRG